MTQKTHLPPPTLAKKVDSFLGIIEWIGLSIITFATLIAIGQEVQIMFHHGKVQLQDILMLFIFLEVLTMVGLYFTSGKLPLRYPIYIAIVAIARYITINMKEMDGYTIVLLSLAMLVLSFSVLVIRYGSIHLSDPQ